MKAVLAVMACVGVLAMTPAFGQSNPKVILGIAQADCPASGTRGPNCGDGYDVFKDQSGAFQYLLVPTDPITGIESPLLLEPRAKNYWAAAWAARTLIDKLAGPILPAKMNGKIPREDIALAVNSQFARSQDQLHIHIDCIDRGAQAALRGAADSIKHGAWTQLYGGMMYHWYAATRISEAELAHTNLFRLVADLRPDDLALMGATTIVVAGAPDNADDLFVLVDRVDPTDAVSSADRVGKDAAWGEELMDHSCSVLQIGQPDRKAH